MSTAGQLGCQPAGDYAATVTAEMDWLVSTAQLPSGFDHGYFALMFDYAGEDDYLAQH
jgi:hypothetical protein